MNSRLLQSLKIHPGEGSRVLLMFFYSLATVGGGVVVGRAVSRSLFLSLLPETATPYKFILPPLFVILGTIAYNRLVPRYPMYRLIAATNLLMISGLLVFRYFLDSNFASNFSFLAALYVYFEVIVTLLGIQFWTFAGEVFNPREAKRLFSLVAAGGVFSNAISGIGLRAVSDEILPKDLIFAVTASLLAGIFCVWTLGKQKARSASPSASDGASNLLQRPDKESASTRQDLWEIARSPMLIILGSLMIITSLVTNIADFQLDLSLQRFYANDGQGMLAFIGTFQIFVGITAFFVQVLLTNRVLERFGLAAGLLLLPFAVGSGSLAFLFSAGALWAMALPRGADMTLRYTINDASFNVLFLPIRESLRKRVKSTLDGVVKPPVIALLGLLFLLFMRDDIDQVGVQARDVLPWSYAILVLLVIWSFLVFRVRKQYKIALTDSIKGHRLAFGHTDFDIKDETTVELIVQELKRESSNPFRIISIIEILKGSEETSWHSSIVPMLSHTSPEVRRAAAQYFEEHVPVSEAQAVSLKLKGLFQDGSADVRVAAIEAYCAILGDSGLDEVVPLLAETDVNTRQAAIIGLMKYAGLSGVMESAVYLKKMFDSKRSIERQAGARVLGALQIPNYYQPLLPLLNDADDAVQARAIQSAGLLKHPALVPRLIEKLGNPRHALNVRNALASYGTGIEPQLAAVLADSSIPAMQISAVKVLRRIHTQTSANILAKYLFDPNDHFRAAIAQALAVLQADGVVLNIKRSDILRATLNEIKRTYSIHLLQADLGENCGKMLGRSLQDNLVYILDHLFSLLSLLYPDQDMLTIYRVLTSSSAQKANALELIDTLADKEIKETLLPLVEAPIDQIIQIAGKHFGLKKSSAEQRLNELTQSADPMLRSFAIYQMGILGFASLRGVVENNMNYNHALVQEAVVWAIAYADGAENARLSLQKQTMSPFETVRLYAERLLEEHEK